MTDSDGTRLMVERFYAAYNHVINGDPAPMLALWLPSPDVTAMHTLGDLEVGWDQVRAVWERVARICSDGQMTITELEIRLFGDLVYAICREQVQMTVAGKRVQLTLRATNIFRREDDDWKVIHHHGDALPAMEAEADASVG
jgi:ketosteroid isomerase-like protein